MMLLAHASGTMFYFMLDPSITLIFHVRVVQQIWSNWDNFLNCLEFMVARTKMP